MSPIPLGILALSGAGGAGGSFELIETINAGSQTSATFSNLNTLTSYKHFQIRVSARSAAGGVLGLNVKVNGNTSNYRNSTLYLNGNVNGASENAETSDGDSSMRIASIPGSSADSGLYGGVVIDSLDFHSTSKVPMLTSRWGLVSGSFKVAGTNAAVYKSATNISSLEFSIAGNETFASNSEFSIYGIRGE